MCPLNRLSCSLLRERVLDTLPPIVSTMCLSGLWSLVPNLALRLAIIKIESASNRDTAAIFVNYICECIDIIGSDSFQWLHLAYNPVMFRFLSLFSVYCFWASGFTSYHVQSDCKLWVVLELLFREPLLPYYKGRRYQGLLLDYWPYVVAFQERKNCAGHSTYAESLVRFRIPLWSLLGREPPPLWRSCRYEHLQCNA